MQINNGLILVLSAAAMAILPATAAPFSFDQAPGRLPKNVVPTSYTIAIVPDTKALTLNGRESVLIDVRAATDTIQFNSLNETLHDVRLDGKPVKHVVSNDEQQ